MAFEKGNQIHLLAENKGRPEKEIDWEEFEKLCLIMCTHDEIAFLLDIDRSTLYDRACKHYNIDDFSTVYAKFTAKGKKSLRRRQFEMSEKSCPMAIWLGKQYLDQKENFSDSRVNPGTYREFERLMNAIEKNQTQSQESNDLNKNNNDKTS